MLKRCVAAVVAAAALAGAVAAEEGLGSNTKGPDAADLHEALQAIVAKPDGPPGAVVVIQRGATLDVYKAGVADRETGAPIDIDDHMRLASVSKAFSGAAALAVVAEGTMTLDDTIGQWRPDLPASWASVTLRQLLAHTSGIDNFSAEDSFRQALFASLPVAPPPRELLSFTGDAPPAFPPGTRYRYSNSDNIIVGLMIESATGEPYAEVLATRVYGRLGLAATTLPSGPEIATPFLHGYDINPPAQPEDVSAFFAAGWAWASGGVVSTPSDVTRFVRGYVSGKITDAATRAAQFTFIAGSHSEPPGPGENAAGLAVFRYQTRCGTVYGHTGNMAGYTQFVAATEDGQRSVSVSVSAQITPKSNAARFLDLRGIFEAGVCAALE